MTRFDKSLGTAFLNVGIIMSQDMPEDASLQTWLVNTTDEQFDLDVWTRSELGLVLVDFWAEWCAPCRILAPTLEAVVNEYRERCTLVKANTEVTPKAAAQFGVQGIPAVYAVLNREIIDSFQGVIPAESLHQWIVALLAQSDLVEVRRLATTDPAEAEIRLREMHAQSPTNSAISLALAEVLFEAESIEEAQAVVHQLEERGFLEPEAEKLKARLYLHQQAGVDIEALQEQAKTAPGDYQLQYQLAEALAGRGDYAAACDIGLSLVERDRRLTGEQARALMVEIFRALPDDSELTSEYRRKLSLALY
jgi:putative thioredoxin